MQVKIFTDEDPDGVEESVNEWLREGAGTTKAKTIKDTQFSVTMGGDTPIYSIAIWYT
jgi:hypothetical protein